jgi:hypothetical protein
VGDAPKPVPIRESLDHSRATFDLVAIIVVLVVVAILKPWAGGSEARPGTAARPNVANALADPGTPAMTLPVATATAEPDAMTCLNDPSQHVVMVERSPGNVVRTWVVTPTGKGTGPTDPALPRVALFPEHLVGLGICSPRAPAGADASATPSGLEIVGRDVQLIDVQSLADTPSGTVATDLGRAGVLVEPRPGSFETTVYAGPQRAAGVAASWTAGSYAVAFRFRYEPEGEVRWLRIDVHVRGSSED